MRSNWNYTQTKETLIWKWFHQSFLSIKVVWERLGLTLFSHLYKIISQKSVMRLADYLRGLTNFITLSIKWSQIRQLGGIWRDKKQPSAICIIEYYIRGRSVMMSSLKGRGGYKQKDDHWWQGNDPSFPCHQWSSVHQKITDDSDWIEIIVCSHNTPKTRWIYNGVTAN